VRLHDDEPSLTTRGKQYSTPINGTHHRQTTQLGDVKSAHQLQTAADRQFIRREEQPAPSVLGRAMAA
jgi:hypothetical protein